MSSHLQRIAEILARAYARKGSTNEAAEGATPATKPKPTPPAKRASAERKKKR